MKLDLNQSRIDFLGLTISPSSFDEKIDSYSTIALLTTLDGDEGDTHFYSLVIGEGDYDNNAFVVDGNQLKIIELPDFEKKTRIRFDCRRETLWG